MAKQPEQALKENTALQAEKMPGVVTFTTPVTFKHFGSITWPEPDEWGMDEWEAYRTAVHEAIKTRKGGPPHDNIYEDFVTCLKFTEQFGTADFGELDIFAWAENKKLIWPKLMTWVYGHWTPYIRSILAPKG